MDKYNVGIKAMNMFCLQRCKVLVVINTLSL